MRDTPDHLVGGSGGGSKKQKEKADNVLSRAFARILIATSEGRIGGLLDPQDRVYIDDVPISQFADVVVDERYGLPGQAVIPGFSGVESVVDVNVEVLTDPPQGRTVPHDVDAIKVIIGYPALMQTDSDGDITGAWSHFLIQTKSASGTFTTAKEVEFYAKSAAAFQVQYKVPRPDTEPGEAWAYQIARLTPDTTNARLQNRTILVGHVEVIEQAETYNNTALLSVSADLEQFGNRIPRVTADLEGLLIPLPSNFDYDEDGNPRYTGVWDGNWRYDLPSSNPIWHLRNLIVEDVHSMIGSDGLPYTVSNKRYSLALPARVVSDAEFYSAARYADGVDENGDFVGIPALDPTTGLTSNIPRATINTVIDATRPAFEWLQTIAATARAAIYVANGQVRLTQDRPRAASMQLTNANVENGRFTYGSTARSDRFTIANVTFNDPRENFQPNIAVYEDEDAIARYGRNESNITIFSTVEAEAHMVAHWIVDSSVNETKTVVFRAGMDVGDLLPGEVIEIADNNYPYGDDGRQRLAGRVLAGSDVQLRLDAPIALDGPSTITVVAADGIGMEQRDLVETTGEHDVVNLTTPLNDPITPNAVFVIRTGDITPRQWRVMKKTQTERMAFEVEAMSYDIDKFSRVEQGIEIILPPYDPVDLSKAAVPHTVSAQRLTRLDTLGRPQLDLRIRWNGTEQLDGSWIATYWDEETETYVPGRPPGVVRYRVSWRLNGASPQTQTVDLPELTLRNIDGGTYEIQVLAINAAGTESPYSEPISYTVTLESTSELLPPQNLRITNPAGGPTLWQGQTLTVAWDREPLNDDLAAVLVGYTVEIRDADTTDLLRTIAIAPTTVGGLYTYDWSANISDGGPRRSLIVSVYARDVVGGLSAPLDLTVNNPAPAVPTGVAFTTSTAGYRVSIDTPSDPDWTGIVVHHVDVPPLEREAPFVPIPQTLAVSGTGNLIDVEADIDATYWVRLAAVDAFGPYGLNYSSEHEVSTDALPVVSSYAEDQTATETTGWATIAEVVITANSPVLLLGQADYSVEIGADVVTTYYRIQRDGTTVFNLTDAAIARYEHDAASGPLTHHGHLQVSWLDQTASTSARTYSLQMRAVQDSDDTDHAITTVNRTLTALPLP